jgi:hypothetical protein
MLYSGHQAARCGRPGGDARAHGAAGKGRSMLVGFIGAGDP